MGIFTATTALWALLGTVVTASATALGIWIKHGPDRKRADTEASNSERSDYAQQVYEFRKEVHKYKNEVQKLQGELMSSAKKIGTMELVIELLIGDAERKNPKSDVVRQAKIMMWRLGGGDPAKSQELNSAEFAVEDAEQAVCSTKKTVADIISTEGKGAGE